MKPAKKPSKITDRVKGLGDKELAELILALKFSTKLEQSVLATALAEKRRRSRRKCTEVMP